MSKHGVCGSGLFASLFKSTLNRFAFTPLLVMKPWTVTLSLKLQDLFYIKRWRSFTVDRWP